MHRRNKTHLVMLLSGFISLGLMKALHLKFVAVKKGIPFYTAA